MATPIFGANTLLVTEQVVVVDQERLIGTVEIDTGERPLNVELTQNVIELVVPSAPTTIEVITAGPQGPAGDGTTLPPEALTLTYTGDQLTSISSASTTKTLSYDPSGSLHQLITTTGTSTVTRTFDYDANGRLTAVVVS